MIALAQHKMLEVFGLELKEITKAPQRGANKAAAGLKRWALPLPPSLDLRCARWVVLLGAWVFVVALGQA